VAVPSRREPQRLFKNGATVAEVVRRGGLIGVLFSACQRAFSRKVDNRYD
jgi:hypothetical protein